jgi:peptidoglycan/xylan/chitin deacetylase (PgdA/CDA1 family)
MKRKILSLAKNPLVLVPPLILALILGWQQYSFAGRDLSLPSAANVFPNSDFSQFDDTTVPAGWHVAASGDAHIETARTKGYAGGHSFVLNVHDYHDGDITATTPVLPLSNATPYLFKSYYTSSLPIELLMREYHDNGVSDLRLLQSYPATGSSWSTVSHAFITPADGTTAVQFVYRLHGNGKLSLNGPYVQPEKDVSLPIDPSGANIVPNSTLTPGDYSTPQDWSTYQTGDNTADFSYQPDSHDASVHVQVHDYKNGEAKWQYSPQTTTAHQYYTLHVTYQSTTTVPVTVEYTLADGQRRIRTLTHAQPAGEWTTLTADFETPPDVRTMFVSLPLQHNGDLATKNYELINSTKPGASNWQRPLLSITFDDGWQLSYRNALPVLQSHHYPATFYINPSAIETPNFMTAAELTRLRDTGNEIAAHGYDHDDLTAINRGALEYQLHQGRDYLQRAGFQVSNAAAPYGRTDAEVRWYAHKYFETLRGTETGINTRQNLDPYNLRVLYVTETTKPAAIQSALAQAKNYNGWLILVYHRIGDNLPPHQSLPAETSTTTVQAFKKQLALVHESGIAVQSIATAYAEIRQQ